MLELRKVLRSFTADTGMSFCAVRPRQWDELCDEALEVLIDILMAVEREAAWPLMTTKIGFIQKRLGGVRPIAIIMVLARVQARLRRGIARKWEEANARPYWWGAAGRSCEQAVWHQAAIGEWATQRGADSGDPEAWVAVAVLLDLLKAFEQVRHHWLLDAAIATGFPLWQLKLTLELYCAPRVLCMGSAASSVIEARQSILPGDGFATALLKLILIGPLDRLVVQHPTVALAVVVDDLMLHRVGGLMRVTKEVAEAAFQLKTLLLDVDLLPRRDGQRGVRQGHARAVREA